MASSRSAAPRRHKRLQIGVSGRLDRTLAFQELCADTGGLDNERTMSDADGGGLATRRPFGPRSALPASSVSRLPGRSRYDGRSPSDPGPSTVAASLRSSTAADAGSA